jgi:dehydrogenase/reductase SDR family protein 1
MARDMAVELEPYKVAALSLWPGAVKTEFILDAVEKGAAAFDLATAESPRFTGRCIAALAQDPDIMRKTGGIYQVAELATEYGFTDPDREMSA